MVTKELYAERKRNGLCVNCARTAIPGVTRCVGCAESKSKYSLKRYYDLRRRSLCANCKGPSDGMSYCRACLDRMSEKEREAKRFICAIDPDDVLELVGFETL